MNLEDFWTSIWGLLTMIVIGVGSIFLFLFLLYLALDDSGTPCSEMTNRTIKSLPVRCYEELGVNRR